MPHQGFNTFSNACERFVYSMATNGPLAPNEAEIVEYYCKEILSRIASSLQPNKAESSKTPSPGAGVFSETENLCAKPPIFSRTI
jgi:hypothetical protein